MKNNWSILKGKARVILVALFCLLSLFLQCQSVWNKTYVADRAVMLFSSIIADNNGYYVTGVTNASTLNIAKGVIGKIDSTGLQFTYHVIDDSIISDDGLFWNAFIKTSENKLAATGYVIDSFPRLLFAISDTNFDSVRVFKYYTPNTSAFQGFSLLQYDENSFYITGVRTDSAANTANVLLVKLDSAGNRLWEKYYDNYRFNDSRKIIKLSNGHLMLGAVRNNLNQTLERANTWLIEVDTGGTIVRQWFDPNDSTYAAQGLLQTSDGDFIYSNQRKVSESGGLVSYKAAIVKMDSTFHKKWEFFGGARSIYTGIADLIELSDGSIIACGQKPYYYNDSTILSGWILKLDSSGNLLWEKIYTGIDTPQVFNFLTDIDILPDGGIIAVGQCQFLGHTPPQVGWFLKLDSNGCEIENCLLGIEEPTQQEPLNLYPNPASNSVLINISSDLLNGALTVYDITGKKMITTVITASQMQLNISSLNSGMYIVQMQNHGISATTKFVKQ